MNDQERQLFERIAGALEKMAENSDALFPIQVALGRIADALTPPNNEPSKIHVNFGQPTVPPTQKEK